MSFESEVEERSDNCPWNQYQYMSFTDHIPTIAEDILERIEFRQSLSLLGPLCRHVTIHISDTYCDCITFPRPPYSSSLKVNNRSFLSLESASKELRLPTDQEYLSLSSDLTHVISFITIVTIHYLFTLPLQAQNLYFPHIISSIVLLPFHPPDWLHGEITRNKINIIQKSITCRFRKFNYRLKP